jgi:hypothetical protein
VQSLASLAPPPSEDTQKVQRTKSADETQRTVLLRHPQTSRNSLTPPGNIYMPGQYNQRTGAVQRDYSHQYTVHH